MSKLTHDELMRWLEKADVFVGSMVAMIDGEPHPLGDVIDILKWHPISTAPTYGEGLVELVRGKDRDAHELLRDVALLDGEGHACFGEGRAILVEDLADQYSHWRYALPGPEVVVNSATPEQTVDRAAEIVATVHIAIQELLHGGTDYGLTRRDWVALVTHALLVPDRAAVLMFLEALPKREES